MGGSSSGSGESGAKTYSRDQEELLNQQRAIANQMTGMANSADVNALAGQGLTQAEQMQLAALGQGRQRAGQTIQQNVRDEATSRGMFSSAGAIGQEASQLAGLDTMQAAQEADVYGNAQNRQFQGLNMKQGLLSGAGGALSGAQQGYGNLGQQNMQMDQYNRQLMQQKQQQQQSGLMAGAKFGMGLLSGGMF